NYLVQHLLEKRIWPLTSGILQTLRGHFANLSTQKYSSNVVENCLKNTTSDERESIIRELLWSPNILDIFVDLYGNYVMQTALSVAKGGVHKELLDVLKKNLPTLTQQG
ncbi:pumilio homolog 12-like, partial [Ananas comosus]